MRWPSPPPTARLRRNFQGYTTDDAPVLLGLGASSIGSLPQGYVQNQPSVPAWRDAVRAGALPVARGIALTDADRLRRAVIEAIMCRHEVDLRAVAAQHGAEPASLMDAAPALQEMARDGLVEWDGVRVVVTPGRPAVRAQRRRGVRHLSGSAARRVIPPRCDTMSLSQPHSVLSGRYPSRRRVILAKAATRRSITPRSPPHR